MDFLNPLFLVMLGAVAVPLLIHIFSRRRIPEIHFSTLRFLRGSDRRSMRSVNLRRLLLLLLRIAAIALIAMAFAGPVIRGGLAAIFPGEGPRAVVILLDRSFSMAVREGERNVFDRAKRRVEEIVSDLSEEDEVTIFLFDTRQEKVFEGEGFKPVLVVDMLEKKEPSFFGTDLRAASGAAEKVLLSSRREIRELFVISDFQRSGTGDREKKGNGLTGTGPDNSDGPKKDKKRNRIKVFMIPVQPGPGANVAIERVLTPRVAVRRGETAGISIHIKNHSSELRARFPLRITVDGKRVVEREIEIEPGRTRTERVDIPVEKAGWIRGEVSKREDRLAVDDRRFFRIYSREKDRVLLVTGDDSFYLEKALSPEGTDGGILLRTRGWNEFVTADIEWADMLVLGPGPEPAEREISILKDFAENGGGILALVTKGHERLINGLSRYHPEPDFQGREGNFETIEKCLVIPDFLRPFEREDMEVLSRVRFRGTPVIRGVDQNAVLLSFRNGSPFVWRERCGEGTILFASFDPVLSGGEFVLSPVFLPLVQQAVLAMDPGREAVEGHLVGERFGWDRESSSRHTVILPGGAEYSPEAAISPQNLMIPVGGIPGFVRISDGEDTVWMVDVNPDCAGESDLSFMTGEEAADSLGFEDYIVIDEQEDTISSIGSARKGREVSLPFIMAAILLLIIELAIAQKKEMATERP